MMRHLLMCGILLAFATSRSLAQLRATPAPPAHIAGHQSLDDAWWTGSLLAPSAATLPRGHVLVEPYLYDVIAAHSNGFGSRTFLVYGLADRVGVALIPTFTYNKVSNGPSSSRIGFGDLTAQAQYRLTQFRPGSWTPTTSIIVQETFPTGQYDQLGDRPGNGFGSGSYSTTVALYSQMYFWMPTGRILRMRLNLSETLSGSASVSGVSVYGTGAGFLGRATPGASSSLDLAAEYSLTKRWVAAFDFTYSHSTSTRVTGSDAVGPVRLDSGPGHGFGFAPAIEYSWTPAVGVIVGTRLIPRGPNTAATVSPAVAINIVR